MRSPRPVLRVRAGALGPLVGGACLALSLAVIPPTASPAEERIRAARPDFRGARPDVKRVIRRDDTPRDRGQDERTDDARDLPRQGGEAPQQVGDPDDARRERERLQELRAGSHGKSCIYGRDGRLLHQPDGVACGRAPHPSPGSDSP